MMAEKGLPEVWLRGPVAGVPPLLQGVAQGLLHSAEEIHEAIGGMTSEQLRVRPSNVASVAFHEPPDRHCCSTTPAGP